VDSHVYAGYSIPPYYDSMIGKLIAHAKNRPLAIRRMEIALEETIVEGIKTTIPFHRLALASEKFRTGDLSTRFVEELLRERNGSAAAKSNAAVSPASGGGGAPSEAPPAA
jgi:acetyl-CoA carboxylase biotin carboxylase subunit